MCKKMTPKKKRAIVIFEMVSCALIFAIMCFYGVRLVKSYQDMRQKMQDAANLAELRLYQVLEAGVNKACTNDGLVFVAGTGNVSGDNAYEETSGDYYYYCGNVENNYVSYGGELYRMLDINSIGEIRVISENVITDLTWEQASFKGSSLYYYLNEDSNQEGSGIFYSSLRTATRLISNYTQQSQILDETGKAVTDTEVKEETVKIGLLSLADYIKFGSAKSYINNGTEFWISDVTAENQHFFISEQGSISYCDASNKNHGVRVVFTFSFDTYASGGTGTKDDPYVIRWSDVEKTVDKASDLGVGAYVSYGNFSYGNLTWRVNSKEEDGVVLSLVGTVKGEDGTVLKLTYSEMQAYLNGAFLTTLTSENNLIVSHEWHTGNYDDFQEMDFTYLHNFEETETSTVSMANSSFLYMDGYTDVFYHTGFQTSTDLVAYVNDTGYIASTLLTGEKASAHAAIPVICVSADSAIISGEGTAENPYVLGGTSHE